MPEVAFIVGLGNPGLEYAGTRHNCGFLLVEQVAEQLQAPWRMEADFQARLAQARAGAHAVVLCEPQTFMNRSGAAVRAVADYFKVRPERILVLVDDADLPLGEIRLRAAGGTGGHHGLESVECHLGTPDYARLRIGIGRRAVADRELHGHVLGAFAEAELGLLRLVLERARAQVGCWIEFGPQRAMAEFNGTVETETITQTKEAE